MSEMSEGQNVQVEVTLTGGLHYSTVLSSTSPVLRDLYLAFGGVSDPQRPAFLIQLPINGGETACSFMSTSLLALQTKPPVLLEAAPPLQQTIIEEVANHVTIEDFLTPDENEQLLSYALANETSFETSSVVGAVQDHRKSKVLHAIKFSKWKDMFLNRLKLHLPYILLALNAAQFRLGNFEMQLTASNDGDFFKPHADSSPEAVDLASRQITYVYYFHREPRPFAGGGLLLYGGRPEPFVYPNARSVTMIEPRNNYLTLFASHCWHELDVVRCPSGAFADSRFTVNGWLHPPADAA